MVSHGVLGGHGNQDLVGEAVPLLSGPDKWLRLGGKPWVVGPGDNMANESGAGGICKPFRALQVTGCFVVSHYDTCLANVGKCLTTGSQKKQKQKKPCLFVVGRFLWHKYTHHGQVQATNMMSLEPELRSDVLSWLSQVGVSRCQLSSLCSAKCLRPFL